MSSMDTASPDPPPSPANPSPPNRDAVEDKDATVPRPASPSRSLIPHPTLSDLAALPTLLPKPIADVVTALATSTRLSLKVATFFIECMLESSQYSTRVSLAYTRRLLITAITSARRLYLLSNSSIGGQIFDIVQNGDKAPTTDGFLQVLDRYTNLGVYVIHHTFTLAELFTNAGFYLTANAIHSAHFAAQESVALFDSLFGSNDTSRALSAIITLVRRELLEDERFAKAGKGKAASLAALTKAMTAFACLQGATWKRTVDRLKMRTLYECTVLAEKDERYGEATGRTLQADPQADTGNHRIRGLSDQPEHERQTKNRHHSNRDSSTSKSREPEGNLELHNLWQLERLANQSDEDVRFDRDPTSVHDIWPKTLGPGDMLEITEELHQATLVTQMLQSSDSDGQSTTWVRATGGTSSDSLQHGADHSFPVAGPSRQRSSPRSDSGDEDEWIAVDEVLGEDTDDAVRSLASSPNGEVSIASMAYRDALERPQANADRIQYILRTMTNKLLQRKRTVRRVRLEELTDAVWREGVTPRKRSLFSATLGRTDAPHVDSEQGEKRHPRKEASLHQIAVPSSQSSSRFESKALVSSPTSCLPIDSSPRAESPVPERSRRRRALSKARAAFEHIANKARKLSRPTTPDHSPSPSRPSTPPKRTSREAGATGVRAPPPTPRDFLRSQSVVKRSSFDQHAHPDHPARPSILSTKESTHSSQTQTQAASTLALQGRRPLDSDFPKCSLIQNLHRFMRFSSAAYGQEFLRIFGIGNADVNFPSTANHHANSWSFAHHTKIPIERLLLSSYVDSTPTFTTKAAPLVHYVVVEPEIESIVLTCRGTLGLSDVLIDLTCEYQQISVVGGDPNAHYFVHSGMYQSALGLTNKRSTVHQTLSDALKKYPTYGLILCGHSLGGGVAALLSIAFSVLASTFQKQNHNRSPPVVHPQIRTPFVTSFASGLPAGRPIHCYAFGTPAVTSPDLAKYTQGLITTVVKNTDIVPTLSLGVLRDLRNIAMTLGREGNLAEEIVGRVIGVYQRKFAFQTAPRAMPRDISDAIPEFPSDEEVLSDWMLSLIRTMRADMASDKLVPPGTVYIIEHQDIFVTADSDEVGPCNSGEKSRSHREAHLVVLRQCDSVEERFREPIFARSMLNDHLPSNYEKCTQLLLGGLRKDEAVAHLERCNISRQT